MNNLLLKNIFFEGKTEDFYKKELEKNPGLEHEIKFLLNKQIPIQYYQWIVKQVKKSNESIEDITPVVQQFEKSKNKLEKKKIDQYKDKNELIYALQDLTQNKQETKTNNTISSNSEQEVIDEKDGWHVVMPYTTKASCELGKSTTWCTAYTSGGNQFLNYVGRPEENIILFYVINPNINPRKNPEAKLSIGFINNEPRFNLGRNNITVDAGNNNLTQERFEEIVGQENANRFLNSMIRKSRQIGGEHPAKEEIQKLFNNNELFFQKINSYPNNIVGYSAKKDLLQMIRDYDTKTTDEIKDYVDSFFNELQEREEEALTTNRLKMIKIFAEDFDEDIRAAVVRNRNTPTEILDKLSDDNSFEIQYALAVNPNSSDTILVKLSNSEDENILKALASNKKTSSQTLKILFDKKNEKVNKNLSKNQNTPWDILHSLSKNLNYEIRVNVAFNPNTSLLTLESLTKDNNHEVKVGIVNNINTTPILLKKMLINNGVNLEILMGIAKNPNITPELLDSLSNSKYVEVKSLVAQNEKTSPETLEKLSNTDNFEVLHLLARNPNTPTSILTTLSDIRDIKQDVAMNPNTPSEILDKLSYDNDWFIRSNVVKNPNTSIETLKQLTNDKDYRIKSEAYRIIRLRNENLKENLTSLLTYLLE